LSAFSLVVREKQLVVHRAHAVRLANGRPLPEAFGTLLPVIQEVGGIDGVHANDFDGLEGFCAILADDGRKSVELLDFGSRDACQAVVLPVATLASSSRSANSIGDLPSAEAILTAGADFVIMRGDGLCGGPACGIIIGPEAELRRIQSSNAWDSLKASDAVQAMMLITLELAASNPESIPVHALIGTGEENLRARAERLATRLSGSDRIKSCQITAEDARLSAEGRWHLPSRQLRLRHSSMKAQEWGEVLLDELPAVVATVDGEELCIDLRWIAPGDDAKLGEILGGKIT
jgi:L-seryl-tRNA(Ser) seleniumtransferase